MEEEEGGKSAFVMCDCVCGREREDLFLRVCVCLLAQRGTCANLVDLIAWLFLEALWKNDCEQVWFFCTESSSDDGGVRSTGARSVDLVSNEDICIGEKFNDLLVEVRAVPSSQNRHISGPIILNRRQLLED